MNRIRLGLVALAVLATLLAGSVGWPDPMEQPAGPVSASRHHGGVALVVDGGQGPERHVLGQRW